MDGIDYCGRHNTDVNGGELVTRRPTKRQRLINDDVLQPNRYDVFISFRGVDVRNSFLSHLYSHLNDHKKLAVYKDDEDIERGEQISPALLQAIERSEVYIVILSPNYGDSQWCVEEIEKIHECKERFGRRVIPVFYGVDTCAFEESPSERLREIAGNCGLDSQVIRPETKLIEEIAEAVFQAIRSSSQMVNFSSYSDSRGLVGVERKIEQVKALAGIGGRLGNRSIGLWGMPGIGKTVLAKALFDRFSCQFEGSYFISNFADTLASGRSLQWGGDLQNDFFSRVMGCENRRAGESLPYDWTLYRLGRKRCLVVIDDVGNDVGNIPPLNDFLNGQYCNLFGPGSITIITSRNKQLLKSACDHVYEVQPLYREEARQLFCLHAFRGFGVPTEYKKLIQEALNHTGRNPLAIVVLGSHLLGRDVEFWKSELDALQDSPNQVIENSFRKSYDGLNQAEKDVLLDIACFYQYWSSSFKKIWDSLLQGKDANIITHLIDKSLLMMTSAGGIKIEMNKLLIDIARSLVNKEGHIGKRSRLWKPKDIRYLFKHKKTCNVEVEMFKEMANSILHFEVVRLS
ncbi:unnamed protein product [Linum tenue]|uniref:TIR domain-containing protein n=1 Tax=Linum tenue TaxID=586396 RepID=A0AAV0RTT5_9ROSI|nr:unnamed protein product [Linum tenue]